MSITILYFANLRETLGIERETVELPITVQTIGDLREWLCARGGNWNVLAGAQVRAALNQVLTMPDASIGADDEVAFFPPVTGG
ncbi:MAG TPA: molybdopterin converting factor subunit 1 [Rhodocyclaceae bacterium]|nr:molybdopterin converting factor subunit 1 [Rhodocyclaceae bacterium]